MPNREVTWKNVWALVRARQEELRWTDKELQDACDISETTYRKGRLDGVPLSRPTKIARLESGLGWGAGSVAAVLAGGQPDVVAAPSAGGVSQPGGAQMEERLRAEIVAVDARVYGLERALHEQMEKMIDQLESLADRVEQVRRESS